MRLIKFLSDDKGNLSNSRLIADIMITFAMLLSVQLLTIGILFPLVEIMNIALAISAVFGAIAGPALAFLFGQKKTETNSQQNISNIQPPESLEETQV